MKTLILYATKYGCTESVAKRLANLIGGAKLCNLKSGEIPPLSGFDSVILGSSLYAGMARKELKTYVNANRDELKTKRLGLFLCGLGEAEESTFNGNFSKVLVDAAHAKGFLGGVFDKSKASGIDRLILRLVMKATDSLSKILDENITSFANEMKKA